MGFVLLHMLFLLDNHLEEQSSDANDRIGLLLPNPIHFNIVISGSTAKQALKAMFQKLADTNFQCIMAVLIPMSKVSTKLALSKIMDRVERSEKESANVLLASRVNFTYGYFVATKLAGARIITMICIVVIDFLMQCKMSHQIIQLGKKVDVHENEKLLENRRRASTKLVLAEMCEGLIPLAYALSFAMSYYGPNAKLIGNVGADIWQYKANEDVFKTFMVLSGLFILDLISLLLNATFIWNCAQFNMFPEFSNILQKHWYIIAVLLADTNYIMFFSNDINHALDMTFQFCWTLGEERFNGTCII